LRFEASMRFGRLCRGTFDRAAYRLV